MTNSDASVAEKSVFRIPKTFITVGLPTLSFIAGACASFYGIASKIATQADLAAAINAARIEFHAYSDSNRQRTLLDLQPIIEGQAATLRGVSDSLKDIKDELRWRREHGGK